ncbi:hypothetical protein PanWU01x14_205320 [Parasponia andersonii]|uniref:Uncharacterized protein n=1 Tax=Parasponia andersonii TaxID=3476 RepID=A0A2P5BW29_PARAD|nr:hypothetical protein PanWU01x14_205320 [Parasponia andersonii]
MPFRDSIATTSQPPKTIAHLKILKEWDELVLITMHVNPIRRGYKSYLWHIQTPLQRLFVADSDQIIGVKCDHSCQKLGRDTL